MASANALRAGRRSGAAGIDSAGIRPRRGVKPVGRNLVMRTSWLWILCGCPYVFGPPDLSEVDGGPPGAEGDPDTDAEIDTSLDPPASIPPVVSSFEVVPRLSEVVLHFALSDPDTELVGSALSLSDGTNQWTVAIPEELDVWEPLGISSVALSIPPIPGTSSWLDCETPVHQVWSAIPVDVDGTVGVAVDAALDIEALGLLPEVGQNLWPDDHTVVSEAPPFMGCVSHELRPGGGYEPDVELARDFEALRFTSDDSDIYVAQLVGSNTNPVDINLFVFGWPNVNEIAGSSLTSGSGSEQLSWNAGFGESWLVEFPFFSLLGGGSPPFRSQFLIAPR